MGFSLESFFEELKADLKSDDNSEEKLMELTNIIAYAEKYAKDCGHIPS